MLRLLDSGPDLGRIWDVDFTPQGPSPDGAGLDNVDHLAQTTAYDEMLNWTLFYTSIFGAQKAAMVDVADPDGLVRSQAIRSGALRITLNGAEARDTLAGRFVSESQGAGFQHIAFGTSDIFATARRLNAAGFAALPIGDNYYDDLEARFGLDPAFTARLRAGKILYDQDGEDAFYQLYSQPHGGLFIEIVQRDGGYDGYGAPNAPFRIAAQKRLRGAQAAS